MGVRLICVDGTNLVRTAYGYGGPEHAAPEDAGPAAGEPAGELRARRDGRRADFGPHPREGVGRDGVGDGGDGGYGARTPGGVGGGTLDARGARRPAGERGRQDQGKIFAM